METIIDKIDYVPVNCLLELCFKCNLNCKHCGSSLNAFSKSRKGRTLTKEEMCKVIDSLKNMGGKKIGLVGGEPLLCDFWYDIAKYASNLDFEVSMISNGMLIDEEIANKIKNSGIKLVALSLDGEKEFHDELRGNPKAYEKVITAAANLRNVGIQVNVITTIMSANLERLSYIEKIVKSLGAKFWQLQIGIPMGKLSKNQHLVLKPNDLVKVSKFIRESKSRGNVEITVADSIGYCSKDEIAFRNNSSTDGSRAFIGCMAGCRAVAIESNGNVKGCLSLQSDYFIEGNILNKTLEDIWNNSENFTYNRKFKVNNLKGDCQSCKYGPICRGGCTSLAYNTSGVVNNNKYCLHLLENN